MPFIYTPPMEETSILYRDDFILVVEKRAGLLSVPGRAVEHRDSLFTRLAQQQADLRVVHRLDMDTSGVMVLACGLEAQRDLSRQFEKKTVEKRYCALVDGHVMDEQGAVDLPLRCDWPNRPLQMVDPVEGKKALTHWTVLERCEDWTRLQLTPITGRSHQLRVHCRELGHVILGDRFYGDARTIAKKERLCLHAQTLSINHPITGHRLTFDSPVPF